MLSSVVLCEYDISSDILRVVSLQLYGGKDRFVPDIIHQVGIDMDYLSYVKDKTRSGI
jgi:hypothetical protein